VNGPQDDSQPSKTRHRREQPRGHGGYQPRGRQFRPAPGAAELSLSLPLQFIIFAIAAIALPLLFRGPLLAHLGGRGVPSRTDGLLGETAVVIEAIDPVRGTGRVSLHGQDWMARCAVPVAVGKTTEVIGADGIVLLVEPSLHPSLT